MVVCEFRNIFVVYPSRSNSTRDEGSLNLDNRIVIHVLVNLIYESNLISKLKLYNLT